MQLVVRKSTCWRQSIRCVEESFCNRHREPKWFAVHLLSSAQWPQDNPMRGRFCREQTGLHCNLSMHFFTFSLLEERFLLHAELIFNHRHSGWSRPRCLLPSPVEGAYTHCEQLPCDFLERRCYLWVCRSGSWLLGDMCCRGRMDV